MKRFLLLELTLISFIGALYFCQLAPLHIGNEYDQPDGLDLQPLSRFISDSSIRPDALEHERLTGSILPVRTGLEHFGRIPVWNPFLGDGVPLLNNPFNYLFNPFHSLPIMLLGGTQGSKVAMFITFLIAGYSMWALGLVIGLGRLARVTAAVLYMLSGSLVAKFGAGHFQLANSLAWPPLVFAALWWMLHSKNRIAPLAVGVTFSLLFYAGNIYYVLHTLLCCAIIVAVHIVGRRDGRWQIQINRLRLVLFAGLFAFGLSALAFLPIWQTRDYVTHQRQLINPDGTLQGSYDLGQTFINLTTPWSQWTGLQQTEPAGLIGAVDYAYIGPVVFIFMVVALLLAALRPAWLRQYLAGKRGMVTLIITAPMLALLMMLWGSGQFPPFTSLYARIPLLAEFRYVGRALAFGGLWWVVLGGVAVDYLLSSIRNHVRPPAQFDSYDRTRLVRALGLAAIAWLYLLVYSAAEVPARVNMTLRNLHWWQRLDGHRFTSVADAAEALFALVVAAFIIDTVLLVLEWVMIVPFSSTRVDKLGLTWEALVNRILRLPLLVLIVLGTGEVMRSNSQAIQFIPVADSLGSAFEAIHNMETETAFPAVKLPFTARSFSAYESPVRNWGLNEGWQPAAPTGILPDGKTLNNLPRWGVIVRDENGNIPVVGDLQFLEAAGYELRGCYRPGIQAASDCLNLPNESALYEYPLALPYAFVVSGEQLITQPATVNGSSVQPVQVISHEMDWISVKAAAADDGDYWLVVQENNFPGWKAARDGVELAVSTVQTAYQEEQQLGLIAVPASAGEHTYTLYFEPPGLTTGLIVFGVTVIVAFFYVFYGWRNSRRIGGRQARSMALK